MRFIPFLVSTERFGFKATAFWTFTRLIKHRHEAYPPAFVHSHELLTTLKANESDCFGSVIDRSFGEYALQPTMWGFHVVYNKTEKQMRSHVFNPNMKTTHWTFSGKLDRRGQSAFCTMVNR